MKKLAAAVVLVLVSGFALARQTGPAPAPGTPERPEMRWTATGFRQLPVPAQYGDVIRPKPR